MADRERSLGSWLIDFILLIIFGPFILCVIMQFTGALLNTVLLTVKAALTQMLPWLLGAVAVAIVLAGISAALAIRNRVGRRNRYVDMPTPGAPPVRRARQARYDDDEFDE